MNVRTNTIFLLTVSAILLTGISCEDVELTGNEYEGEYEGNWEFYHGSGDYTYLTITQDEVTFRFKDGSAGCYTQHSYSIERIDGNGFYVLNDGTSEENKVYAFSRSESRLHVRDIGDPDSKVLKYRMYTEGTFPEDTPRCMNEELLGYWKLTDEDRIEYMTVETETVTITEEESTCFLNTELKVLTADYNKFRLYPMASIAHSSTDTLSVVASFSEDTLQVSISNQVATEELAYAPFETDPRTFTPVCSF